MNRQGVVLVEVLVALAILGTAGVSTVLFVTAHAEAQARIFQREDETVRAERLLLATSLLSRSELDQRLGAREVGALRVHVDRPEPRLYRIAVTRAASGEGAPELLVTVVHRPEEPAREP